MLYDLKTMRGIRSSGALKLLVAFCTCVALNVFTADTES